MSDSGTEWTVPGQGSSLGELLDALGEDYTASGPTWACPKCKSSLYGILTDLKLTGRLLDEHDRLRIREEISQAHSRIGLALR